MAKDILIDDLIKNGDLNVGYSDEQHIQHVIMSTQGDFKNSPLTGVNIAKYIHAPMTPQIAAELSQAIRLQLEADNAQEIQVNVNPQTTDVYANASYH